MNNSKQISEVNVDTYRLPGHDLSSNPVGVRIWDDVCDVRCHKSNFLHENRLAAKNAFEELHK